MQGSERARDSGLRGQGGTRGFRNGDRVYKERMPEGADPSAARYKGSAPFAKAAPGGETHVQRTMAQEASRQSGAVAGNLDDGLRLRSVPVGAVAEAAGLPHLDLRLPHGAGRQGVLRAGLRPAPEAAERGAGPHLQPDQQSRSRNARGPAGDLGRGRGQPGVRLGHGGHFDQPLGLCAARLGHRSFGPGLWRHGLSVEEDPAAIRRDVGRVPGGGRDRARWRRRSIRPARIGPVAALYLETPANPTNGLVDIGRARAIGRRPQRRRWKAPGRHRRQHDARTLVPDAARPRRRSGRDVADQICRRPFRSDRRRLLGRGGRARSDPRHAHDPRHDVRSAYRLAPDALARNAEAQNDRLGRGRAQGGGLSPTPSRRSPRSGIWGSCPRTIPIGRSSSASARARARPSASRSRAARRKPSPCSTGSK